MQDVQKRKYYSSGRKWHEFLSVHVRGSLKNYSKWKFWQPNKRIKWSNFPLACTNWNQQKTKFRIQPQIDGKKSKIISRRSIVMENRENGRSRTKGERFSFLGSLNPSKGKSLAHGRVGVEEMEGLRCPTASHSVLKLARILFDARRFIILCWPSGYGMR